MQPTLSSLALEPAPAVVTMPRGEATGAPVAATVRHGRGTKVEQWGLCVSCDRWFYCGTSADQTRHCRCPACDQTPVAIRETWGL